MTQAQPQIESSILPSAGEIEVIIVPPHVRSDVIDEQITKHLEPSLAYGRGRIDMEQVFKLRDEEEVQVFLGFEDGEIVAVTVTKIIEWTTGLRCLKVLIAGGYGTLGRALKPMLAKMEEFAQLAECKVLIIEGRNGWGRVLPEGYEFTHSVFEKEIS
jgi:hypothetical protein